MGSERVAAVLGLSFFILALVKAGDALQCHICSSDLDKTCISQPTVTTNCSTAHGSGCATRLLPGGIVERGCSTIGLSPSGCRVSELAGTECVCHTNMCNTRTSVEAIYMSNEKTTLDCYQCSSEQDTDCLHDIDEYETQIKTCPAKNGCYLNKRVDENGAILYHRLCFNDTAPATYYPGGCYTVFNRHASTTSEVCVCYADRCNKNSLTSLQSLKVEKSEQVVNSAVICRSASFLLVSCIAGVLFKF